MDQVSQNKGFLISVLVTIALLVGGIFLFSGKDKASSTDQKVADEILIPADSYKTSTGSAQINLVEFGDYQCPACGIYHPFVKKLIEEEGSKVNFVFRHFPLSQHKNAPLASFAAEAAGKQEKFWQMHDKLYESQTEWSNLPNPLDKFTEYAKGLSLDIDKFKKDIDSKEIKDKVTRDTNDGTLIGINATPTYFVNGIKITLPGTYEEFKSLVLTSK